MADPPRSADLWAVSDKLRTAINTMDRAITQMNEARQQAAQTLEALEAKDAR